MADPTQRVRSGASKSGSPVRKEPFDHLIQHIKHVDPMLYEALQRMSADVTNVGTVVTNVNSVLTTSGNSLNIRTIDLNDLTVGNDIAHATILHGPTGKTMKCLLIAGVLRSTISADLTVRLNVWIAGISSVIGTFTIPVATAINIAVPFKKFVTTDLPELSVLTWDITGSDGSIDGTGIASFSMWYQ